MLEQLNLKEFIPQSIRCLKIIGESVDFFRKHKLWKGIFEHKWILLLAIGLSVLFTYTVISNLVDYFAPAGELANGSQDNKETALFGGSKFLLLILLEVVIFHFSVKTLEVLNNEKYTTNFGMFVKAEVRMFKVMIRGYVYSLIIQILLSVVLSLTNTSFLLPIILFVVHSYFIGYAFFDNYNEQQKLNIKESDICVRYNSGGATTLGIITSLGLMIPIIGPLFVPVFGAIAANIYGFRYNIENPPGHSFAKKEELEEVEEYV